MTTQQIIESLRELAVIGVSPVKEMRAAADRLEELDKENTLLAEAVCSGNSFQAEKLVQQRDEARSSANQWKADAERFVEQRNTARAEVGRMQDACVAELERMRKSLGARPEPSRLEIAAMLLAAMCGSQYTWTNAEGIALRKADVLIAATREDGK